MIKPLFLLILGSLLLISCDSSNKTNTADPDKELANEQAASPVAKSNNSDTNAEAVLQELYEQAKKTLFKYRPASATMFGLSAEESGVNHYSQHEIFTPEQESKMRAQLRQLSQQIAAVDASGLSPDEQASQQVMSHITRYFAGDESFSFGYIDTWMGLSPYIINQINGPLVDMPRIMQNDQPLQSEQHALDYIALLATYDELTDSVIAKFNADKQAGWVPPKVTLQGALKYLEGFTQANADEHPLVVNFKEKVLGIEDLTQEKKQALISEAVRQVETVVYPGYQAAVNVVRNSLDGASEDHGIWSQPNGAAYYLDAIRQLGDSDLSAEDIHNIGLAEVDRIEKEMDAILKPLGYVNGSVGKRMAQLNEEPRFLYEDSEAGRAQLLEDLNGYIAEMNEAMKDLFKTKPPYDVVVRAFPKEVQDGAPGGQYSPPSLDGSKPGTYWINLRDMKANPKFGLKTLTYHEANPGHHWQIALNLAQDGLPFLQRIAPYNAYIEGWALYSEQVAKEIGMYDEDPYGDLGRLQAELFRAVRLVVDTGLHHKKWTREQAIEYMAATTGSAQSDVVAEIERYIVWPGQALGYKLGMLKILELREIAEQSLGEQFDIAEFHDLVLLGGAVPMSVLEAKVKRWIEQQKPAA